MNHERNLGVTEARLGLTLVIGLLLALGYMMLHYLGGTRQAPTIEVHPHVVADPAPAANAVVPESDEQPQVLTIETNDVPGRARRTSPDDQPLR